MPKSYTVVDDYHDSRLDRWFTNNVISLPHSLIEKIIRQNKIKVNKKKTKSSYRVQSGDLIEVYDFLKLKPTNKEKKIKYKPKKSEVSKYDDYVIEDNENFIIINKPPGVAVQGGTKSFKNIIDAIKNTKYFMNSNPYTVHRIDKETSGLLIIAKNRKFAQLFTSLFRIRKIHKTYVALTYGKISKSSDTLKDDLVSYDNGKKIIQKAISHIKVLKSSSDYSYVELNPITGRKHQLRKQLYNIGNPIVGDIKYNIIKDKNKNEKKLMLHAYKIKFMINNKKFNFMAELPDYFDNYLNKKRLII